ncbi:hypothetical protein DPV78_007261, partial [Talaromyces pinophilus]
SSKSRICPLAPRTYLLAFDKESERFQGKLDTTLYMIIIKNIGKKIFNFLNKPSKMGDYALQRNYLASARLVLFIFFSLLISLKPTDAAFEPRLNLQSYLWKDSLGYTVHPSILKDINLSAENRHLSFADVGTGTGIWLVNLAQELLPNHVATRLELDGFDINLAQCPPQESMPSCLNFYTWDALNEPESTFIGKYDVVHVRLFMINVREETQPGRLIQNLKKLLKPGGWIQWEEVNNCDNRLYKANPAIESPATEELLEYILAGSKNHRGADDWFLNLDVTFRNMGFDNVHLKKFMDPPALRRWLLTLEEFSRTRLQDTDVGVKNLRLIQQSYKECLQGVTIELGKLALIAKMPKSHSYQGEI